MIVIGNRFNDIADRYFENGKKRLLIADLLRLVEQKTPSVRKNLLLKSEKNAKQKRKRKPKHKKRSSKFEKKRKEKKEPKPEPVKLKIDFKIMTKYAFSMEKVWGP